MELRVSEGTRVGTLAVPWDAEQVLALAADPASAKAGQSLARAAKWSATGSSARALWGRCEGSGKQPYQTMVDLAGPAFRCSCPSRKFPCKVVPTTASEGRLSTGPCSSDESSAVADGRVERHQKGER
jgi:hypothetical protein